MGYHGCTIPYPCHLRSHRHQRRKPKRRPKLLQPLWMCLSEVVELDQIHHRNLGICFLRSRCRLSFWSLEVLFWTSNKIHINSCYLIIILIYKFKTNDRTVLQFINSYKCSKCDILKLWDRATRMANHVLCNNPHLHTCAYTSRVIIVEPICQHFSFWLMAVRLTDVWCLDPIAAWYISPGQSHMGKVTMLRFGSCEVNIAPQ
jgi:hypothetical protein